VRNNGEANKKSWQTAIASMPIWMCLSWLTFILL